MDNRAEKRRQAVLEALRRASQASTRPAAKHEGSQQAQEPRTEDVATQGTQAGDRAL